MDDSAHGDFLDSSPKPEECVMQDPPYPSDTRAKGWRLEIDHERIDQSDTWALAKPEVRPWLLMLWLVAWKQTPCGSLPAEDDLIAARIGMSAIAFSKHRAVLMRGWWLAEDGRLYHNVLVQRVQEMLAKRMKDAERAAKSRSIKSQSQANHAGVTRDADVTHAFPTREFDTKHQAPEPEPGNSKTEARKKIPKKENSKPDALALLALRSVPEPLALDWISLRKEKRLPITETAVAGIEREALKAGMPFPEAIRICCEKGWAGFEAIWLLNGNKIGKSRAPPTLAERNKAAFEEAEKMIFGEGGANAAG